MAKKKSSHGECVYCGQVGPLTRDHIPPKCLFPKPAPPDLITVPCCRNCNSSASKDDEYLKVGLSMMAESATLPHIEELCAEIYRGLTRPEKTGFKHEIISFIIPIDVFSPSGLYLGMHPGYKVNRNRLDNVASRIIRGLFFKDKGYRLPDDYTVISMEASGIEDHSGCNKERMTRLMPHLLRYGVHSCANGQFRFVRAYCSDLPNASAWILSFFDRLFFIGTTRPLFDSHSLLDDHHQ